LETLRNAVRPPFLQAVAALVHALPQGVRVWMLTGDKIETATCIARLAWFSFFLFFVELNWVTDISLLRFVSRRSARLVDRMQPVFTFVAATKEDAADQLMRYR
jgi:hypothetical protein